MQAVVHAQRQRGLTIVSLATGADGALAGERLARDNLMMYAASATTGQRTRHATQQQCHVRATAFRGRVIEWG